MLGPKSQVYDIPSDETPSLIKVGTNWLNLAVKKLRIESSKLSYQEFTLFNNFL